MLRVSSRGRLRSIPASLPRAGVGRNLLAAARRGDEVGDGQLGAGPVLLSVLDSLHQHGQAGLGLGVLLRPPQGLLLSTHIARASTQSNKTVNTEQQDRQHVITHGQTGLGLGVLLRPPQGLLLLAHIAQASTRRNKTVNTHHTGVNTAQQDHQHTPHRATGPSTRRNRTVNTQTSTWCNKTRPVYPP